MARAVGNPKRSEQKVSSFHPDLAQRRTGDARPVDILAKQPRGLPYPREAEVFFNIVVPALSTWMPVVIVVIATLAVVLTFCWIFLPLPRLVDRVRRWWRR